MVIHLSSKFLLFSYFTLLSCFLLHVQPNTSQTVEIIDGSHGVSESSGDCPPPQPPIPQPPPPQPPLVFLDERLAVVYPTIQRFKNLISSDPLGIINSWTGSDICNYRGFYCESPPDNSSAIALASIDFNGFQLGAASLNGFIDQLPDIALFHANTNNFSGSISPNIAKLRYLYELDLSNNKFIGPFPPALLITNNLDFLDIRFNSFSGSVPPQIFSKKLSVFFLNNNIFGQTLPQNLGLIPALFLTLANNYFVGPIPRSIGNASNTLREILFLNNQLSGCLPHEIGYLKELTLFDASYNRLTGPLPCSFGCLNKIEILNFTGNLLYGQIPEVICSLGSLGNLSLSYNYFTYVGPICKKLIESGALDVKKNCIIGFPDQRSKAECVFFYKHFEYCPFIESFSVIPCKLPEDVFDGNQSSSGKYPKAPSLTYSALERHRL